MINQAPYGGLFKEHKMNPLMHYFRLRELQYRCWKHGHKKWAFSLGAEMKALLADNPGKWQQDTR